jgi:hypothetical protein
MGARMDIVPAFLDTARTYGAESVEMEWRLPLAHPTLAKAMVNVLTSSPAFDALDTIDTKEEYSDGDCRRITCGETVSFLYKRRITRQSRGPSTVTVSLERFGNSPGDVAFPIYREKHRQRWRWRCWEVHITEFYTNDHRYKDSDGVLYDIELEFQPTMDDIYKYPIDTIVRWGDSIIQGLKQAALISTSSQK